MADVQGFNAQLFDGIATSSGGTNTSRRILFDGAYANYGLCVIASSSGAAPTVTLYGSASRSTAATGYSLIAWTTDTGITVWASTVGYAYPCSQIWGEISASSSGYTLDAYVTAY